MPEMDRLITPTPNPVPRPPGVRQNQWQGVLGSEQFLEGQTQFHSGSSRHSPRAIAAWSIAASLIDLLLTVGMVCFFLFSLLLVKNFFSPDLFFSLNDLTQAGVVLFPLIWASNLIFLRIFLGHTCGDWAVGLRAGEPRQRLSSKYSLLVLSRFFVVVGTGVFFLPLLSVLFGKDIAGKLSGLSLIAYESQSK